VRRRLLKLAAAFLLTFWVVAAALWGRSFFFTDGMSFVDTEGSGFVSLIRGRLVYSYQPLVAPNAPAFRVDGWVFNVSVQNETDNETSGSALCFSSGHYFTSMAHDREWWSLPLWWAVGGAALLALPVFLRLRLPRERGPSGRCANCSYDLTGNTSGTCPECGTPTTGTRG